MSDWDVIIVGAGATGLAAAWAARAEGASVLVVNKGLVGRSGATITSGGGISVAGQTLISLGLPGDPEDTEEKFLYDTIRAGSFVNDQHLVASMVVNVGAELKVFLDRGNKVTVSKRPPGHSSGRGVRIPGVDMQRVMTQAAVQAGARFREDFQSAGLLRHDDGVVGVAGLDRRTGEVEAIHGRTVVLATGGTTSNWRLRTAPEELTGDGHAMALAAGAELIEMEMLQFLPCCLVAPDIWRGLQFPWIIGPQGGYRAWLLNRFGERFMANWDPVRMELSTRDMVSAASATEVLEGRGSPNGGVYLSWAHLPRDIVDNLPRHSPSISQDWRWEGFDMTPLVDQIRAGRAIEVAPAAHFSIGGIRINTAGETGVPGLFAGGEATGGLHGGNRLSGSAGAQILVQGSAAGRSAAKAARGNKVGAPAQNWAYLKDRIEAPFRRENGVVPLEVKQRLTGLAESALGAVRTGPALEKALAEVRDIGATVAGELSSRNRDRVWNRDWSDALEVQAAVPVLESALLSALGRSYSVGAHQRHDWKGGKPGALHHGFVRQVGETLAYHSAPVEFPFLSPVSP